MKKLKKSLAIFMTLVFMLATVFSSASMVFAEPGGEDTVTLRCHIQWEDNENEYDDRPASIKLRILRNYEEYLIVDTKDYYGEYEEVLPKYDNEGNPYKYMVEVVMSGEDWETYYRPDVYGVHQPGDDWPFFRIEMTYNPVFWEVEVPVAQDYTYDGWTHYGLGVASPESYGFSVTGVDRAKDAGTYEVVASLTDIHAIWSDGTKEPKTYTWKINKAVAEVQAPEGRSFTYTGRTYTGVQEGDNYTLSGTFSAKEEGAYVAIATLNEHRNYAYTWTDGTTDPKEISWEIQSPTFSEDAIKLIENANAPFIKGGKGGSSEGGLWFGKYKQSSDGKGGFNDDPIKWRVLSNSSGRLLILSDKNLYAREHMWPYYHIKYWAGSLIRDWLNGTGVYNHGDDFFIESAFSSGEDSIIPTVTLNHPRIPPNYEPLDPTYDRVFLLSSDDVRNPDYGFTGDDGDTETREVRNTDYAVDRGATTDKVNGNGIWWLRTNANDFMYVGALGELKDSGWATYSFVGVRPALYLDLGKVIFASTAFSGKLSGDVVDKNALTHVGTNNADEWKLTIRDGENHAGFKVESVISCDEENVLVDYSGAAWGENEYISAIIKDSNGRITYYGRVKESDGTLGTAAINVAGKMSDGDKLYLFNEQFNGDFQTDYASDLKEIKITKNSHETETIKTPATLTKNGAIVEKCTLCGETVTETVIYSPGTFKLQASAYTYNGKSFKPAVTVKDTKGNIIASSNYSVTYTNNVKAGNATARVRFNGGYYTGTKDLSFTIKKAANPLSVKAKTATVKHSAVKKKAQTLAVGKVITFTKKGQGKLTYTKASGNKKITINKTTGKVTVKKGLKKGTYKVKVKVKAAGNANYNASGWKTVTFKVKVK